MTKAQQRQKYLSEIWQAYPAMPSDAVFAGRVTEITDDLLQIDGRNFDRTEDESLAIEELLEILIPGDIVCVSSKASGDESLQAREQGSAITSGRLDGNFGAIKTEGQLHVVLLAPCVNPLGIPMGLAKQEALQKWSEFLAQVRSFFTSEGFLEIPTPSLVQNPGTEPTLDPFQTTLEIGTKIKQALYLPTSPELHLKKTLAMGYRKIFEIKPCFRNGEITETHEPEFTMLEWYRAYADLNQIREDLKMLIREMVRAAGPSSSRSIGIAEFSAAKELPFHSRSVSELFHEHLDFNLTPRTTAQDLFHLCQKKELPADVTWSFDDLFHYLFVTVIEPQLETNEPMFVYDYPPSQAALARLTKDGWGDRFELYWKGLELCNAFHELNDPVEQRKRSQEDLEKKRQLGKPTQSLDEDFFLALESGLPPSAGIALGLERLFMAIHDIDEIEALKLFSYQKYLDQE